MSAPASCAAQQCTAPAHTDGRGPWRCARAALHEACGGDAGAHGPNPTLHCRTSSSRRAAACARRSCSTCRPTSARCCGSPAAARSATSCPRLPWTRTCSCRCWPTAARSSLTRPGAPPPPALSARHGCPAAMSHRVHVGALSSGSRLTGRADMGLHASCTEVSAGALASVPGLGAQGPERHGGPQEGRPADHAVSWHPQPAAREVAAAAVSGCGGVPHHHEFAEHQFMYMFVRRPLGTACAACMLALGHSMHAVLYLCSALYAC